MRAAIGYDRARVINAGVRLELRKRDSLRHFLAGAYGRMKLRIEADGCNNVGRLCNYSKGDIGRPWQIKVALKDQNYNGFYLIEHIHTGERKIVWREFLHNLY